MLEAVPSQSVPYGADQTIFVVIDRRDKGTEIRVERNDLEATIGELGDNRLGGLGVVLDQENPVHDPRSTFRAAPRRAVGKRGRGAARGHVQCSRVSNARP